MASVQTFDCPKCGAPLEARDGAKEVRCQYCGTLAEVQRGVPARPLPAAASAGGSRAGAVIAVGSALSLAAIAGVVLATRGSTSVGGALSGVSQFDSPPMLADVNGDGVPDVVGHVKALATDDDLAAFDGATGKLLWKVSMPADAFKGSQALVGDLFVAVDELGKVQASRLSNGSPAWAGLLSDKAESFCKDGGSVVIGAHDGTFTRFDLATGKKSAVDLAGKKRPACAAVYQTCPIGTMTPAYEEIDWPEFAAHHLPELYGIPDMMAHRALVPTGSGPSFMLGARKKGTNVAMVAAVENGAVLWKDLVPGVDPLTTDVNVTTILAASDGARVVIPYALTTRKGIRMACFDAKTGKRLWDVKVHDGSQVEQGITMEAGRVYYASWTSLYVLSAADGKHLYQIGTDF